MADEADLGNEQAARFLQEAILNRAVEDKLTPRGNCYFCECTFDKTHPSYKAEDATFSQKLFCDVDCSSDYEKEKRIRSRR
ncbi:MAG: hypothetical protein Q7S87_16425 [Agitococcus sp.]|nr:hypothetical protein [Agitococcus sp.]MDO9176965.1 hypothetical protein [Agitococcus sp.]